jgi:hypothetical protein
MRLWYSPALFLLLCSCTMPIQTSTQVRTVQTTDLGVLRRTEADLLAAEVKIHEGSVLVDVSRLQSCARVSEEQQEIATRTQRKMNPVRTSVEVTALSLGVVSAVSLVKGWVPSRPDLRMSILAHFAVAGGIAGLVNLIVDRTRTFDKTTKEQKFVRHETTTPFVCERQPFPNVDVSLRFSDGNSIQETTELDGRAVFPRGFASNLDREPHPHPVPERNALFPLPIDGEGVRG